jgi:hypothetical protein
MMDVMTHTVTLMRKFTIPLLALALLGAGMAGAADKPKKEGAFGKGSGPMLTREQLRDCLSRKPRLAQQDDDLAKEQAALVTTKAEMSRSGEALKTALETLDRTNEEAVATYNDQAQARDKQIDEYQARVGAFNARVEAAKTERDAFTASCENRRYLEDDEIAIRKGK